MESTTKPIIKGAIFDLDGTLINSIIFWDYFWRDLGENFLGDPDFRPDPSYELKVRTMLFTDVIAFLKELHHLPQSQQELYQHFSDSIVRFYREIVEIKEGVLPFLQYLKDLQIPMCIASASSRDHIMVAAERCGLLPYFDVILTCAELGKGKDQPDIYRLAAETLGTPKEETWVFEDSLLALTTAHNFGLKTVGVYDAGEPRQAEMQALADAYIGPHEGMVKFI